MEPQSTETVEERTSPEDIDAIELQVKKWAMASVAAVREQEDEWALLNALHENEIGPNQWSEWGQRLLDPSQSRQPSLMEDALAPWYSNTLYSPSHLIDMVLANVYGAIFDGPDWLTISCEESLSLDSPITAFQNPQPDMQEMLVGMQGPPPGMMNQPPPPMPGMGSPPPAGLPPEVAPPPPQGMMPPGMPPGMGMPQQPPPPPPQDNRYPLGIRMQELLKSYLEQGQIHARLADAIKDWALLGTMPLKASWHKLTTLGPKGPDGLRETIELESHPVLHSIPLNNFLPDPSALSNNTQEWRMVGHRVSRTWDEIDANFRTRQYDLGEDEFREKWGPEGSNLNEPDSITMESTDGEKDDELTRLWVWEIHGQFATSEGFIEGSVTLISDDKESCLDAVLVRYIDHPVLPNGLRPIVVGHFSPRKGWAGKGLIHCSQDLIYSISQIICQLQDNAKLTAIGMWSCPEASSQWKFIEQNGGRPFPGMVAPYDGALGDKLEPLMMPQFNADVLLSLLQFFIQLLERRTVTETYQGQTQKRQTATEAAITQQQSQRPVVFRQDLLARTVLEPALNLCLSLVCAMAVGDKKIVFTGTDGNPQPATITQQELRNNEFTVQLTMTRQDHTRIAKAQSLERMIPMLGQMKDVLGNEGYEIAINEIVKRYLDCLGIEGVDRILHLLTPEEKQMRAMQEQMAMMQAQGPPQGGPGPGGGTPEPPQIGPGGGPIGDQSDLDVHSQNLQNQALERAGRMV